MAEIKTKNSRTRSVGETNYQNKMFQGQQFETVEEAIEAGAKAYAKLEWGSTKLFCEELAHCLYLSCGAELPSDEILAQLLVDSKRKTIIASMQKRESTPKAFQ